MGTADRDLDPVSRQHPASPRKLPVPGQPLGSGKVTEAFLIGPHWPSSLQRLVEQTPEQRREADLALLDAVAARRYSIAGSTLPKRLAGDRRRLRQGRTRRALRDADLVPVFIAFVEAERGHLICGIYRHDVQRQPRRAQASHHRAGQVDRLPDGTYYGMPRVIYAHPRHHRLMEEAAVAAVALWRIQQDDVDAAMAILREAADDLQRRAVAQLDQQSISRLAPAWATAQAFDIEAEGERRAELAHAAVEAANARDVARRAR
jgi:hypothetical protein